MIFLLFAPLVIISWLGSAWAVMITVGAAHSLWWNAMPTMGFGDALTIVTVFAFASLLVAAVVRTVAVALIAFMD